MFRPQRRPFQHILRESKLVGFCIYSDIELRAHVIVLSNFIAKSISFVADLLDFWDVIFSTFHNATYASRMRFCSAQQQSKHTHSLRSGVDGTPRIKIHLGVRDESVRNVRWI